MTHLFVFKMFKNQILTEDPDIKLGYQMAGLLVKELKRSKPATPKMQQEHVVASITVFRGRNHPTWLQLSHPLSSPLLLPSIFPSIRVFSDESVLHIRWPKYWSFSFSTSPSNEHPGLISFRIDCLDLLAVQGTLKSLLQHHSSKVSILWCSAFFIVQLSHLYMTTGKTIALT